MDGDDSLAIWCFVLKCRRYSLKTDIEFLDEFSYMLSERLVEIIRPYDVEASLFEALVDLQHPREETHDIHWFLHVCYRWTKEIEYDFIDLTDERWTRNMVPSVPAHLELQQNSMLGTD